jgi:hypothetical protein
LEIKKAESGKIYKKDKKNAAQERFLFETKKNGLSI